MPLSVSEKRLSRSERCVLLGLSFLLVSVGLFFQGHVGLNLADEGFLWYGTAQVALGKVPLRDFQSYEPGRYYWGAIFFKLFDSSLFTLRCATSLFYFIGLASALAVLRKANRSWFTTTFLGILLVAWNYKYYRTFEITFSLSATLLLLVVMERRTLTSLFFLGFLVGLAGWFGRNLGLYILLSAGFGLTYIHFRVERMGFLSQAAWLTGLGLGLAPLFVQILIVPDFAGAFLNSFKQYIALGRTNLTIPIPWPWQPEMDSLSLFQKLKVFFGLRLGFVLVPLYGILGAIWSWRPGPPRFLLAASAIVCLTFSHYALSRADLEHLSVGIQPFLLGLFTLPVWEKAGTIVILLGLTGAQALYAASIQALSLKLRARPEPYVKVSIQGVAFWLPSSQGDFLQSVRSFCNTHLLPSEPIFIAPHWPALYTFLGRASPTREIYLLFPAPESRQLEMIQDLRNARVNWVLLEEPSLKNGPPGLQETHPLLWRHLKESFQAVDVPGMPVGATVARRIEPFPIFRSAVE